MSKYNPLNLDEQGIQDTLNYGVSRRQQDSEGASLAATLNFESPDSSYSNSLFQGSYLQETSQQPWGPHEATHINHIYQRGHFTSGDPDESTRQNHVHQQGDPNPDQPRSRRNSTFHIWRCWTWEMMASMFSLVCMVAVVIVLCYEQGKPLGQWNQGIGRNISPSVVVSFIGTLGRSSSMLAITEVISQLKWMHFSDGAQRLSDLQLFDEASRGPWGASVLILTRNKSTALASCASILVVLSLLMDPFMQLIFDFPMRLVTESDKPDPILTTQMYDPQGLLARNNQCSDYSDIEPNLQAAILSPAWNSSSQPIIPCQAERCEWPTITTLGVCSECIDVTDRVKSNCSVNNKARVEVFCTYTLEGIPNRLGAQLGTIGGAAEQLDYNTIWNSTQIYYDGGSGPEFPVKAAPATLVNFWYYTLPKNLDFKEFLTPELNRVKRHPKIKKAMMCNMTLCARTFEKPFAKQSEVGKLSGPTANLRFTTVPEESNSVELLGMTPASSDHVAMNTTFGVNFCDYLSLAEYLSNLFTVGAYTKEYSSGLGHITPDIGMTLGSSADIPALLEQISFSMTDVIRRTNSTGVHGTQMNTVTFISISWGWLALPLAVVLSSFATLIVVILMNEAQGVPPWKSSSLALLFHSVDKGWSIEDMSMPKQLRKEADNIRARVWRTEGLYRFVSK